MGLMIFIIDLIFSKDLEKIVKNPSHLMPNAKANMQMSRHTWAV